MFFSERDIILEEFIRNYGYYAVFAFSCIEGEVALLTAGYLCKQGLMSLPIVIFVAFFGTLITEQSLFFIGRVYGYKILKKFPSLAKKSTKVLEFLQKYDSAFIFCSRFIYGIRNVSPIIIGVAKIPPLKFSILNIPAAFIWAVLVACAGYFFANMLDKAQQNLDFLKIVALFIFCFAVFYYMYHKTNQVITKRRRR